MEPLHFENEEPECQKKGLLAKFGVGNTLNIICLVCTLAYLLGIHKTEMAELSKSVERISSITEDNAKRIERIDLSGPEFGKRLALKVDDNEKHLIRLDAIAESSKQKGSTVDISLTSLDTRVTRLEEGLTKVALLQNDVKNLVDSQKELKADLRSLVQEIKELSGKIK